MTKPILSVIIPVYNASNTLERCLKSVLNQTLCDIEIIIIDDCSDDNSREIIKRNCNEKTVFIQNEKNQGVGASRNIGLERARGKYVGFVDNDDFVEENYFYEMVKKLEEKKADVCVSLKITNHTGKKNKKHFIKKNNLKRAVFVDRTAPWAKVIRLNFLRENNIKFDNSRGEDIFPAFLEGFLTDKITYIDNSSYHCTIHQGSVSHRKISEKDLDEIRVYKKIIDYGYNESFWRKLIKERALISVDFLYKNADKELKNEVLFEYQKLFNSKHPYFEYFIFRITNFIKKIKSHLRGVLHGITFN